MIYLELPISEASGSCLIHPNCQECGLHEGQKHDKVFFSPRIERHAPSHYDPSKPPADPKTNTILIVGDKPSPHDSSRYEFNGFSVFEDRILRNLEVAYCYTTLVRCCGEAKPKQKSLCGSGPLNDQILSLRPKAIVALGKDAFMAVCANLGIDPPSRYGDVEGKFMHSEQHNIRVYAAKHITSVINKELNQDAINEHYYDIFSKAEAWSLDEAYRAPINFTLCRTGREVVSFLGARRDYTHVAVDVETNYPLADKKGTKSLDRNSIWKENSEIVCLSITIGKEISRGKFQYRNAVLCGEALRDKLALIRIFDDKVAVLHNAKFDLQAMYQILGFDVLEYASRSSRFEDTQLAFYLSDQNRLYTNLKDLARNYIEGAGDWETAGHMLVMEANIKIDQTRRALKAEITEVHKHFEALRTYRELHNRSGLLGSDKRRLTSARAKLAPYLENPRSEDPDFISQLIDTRLEAATKQLRELPQPNMASYADIPITKLAEYNAEDTFRTLQLWFEILPALERLEGVTYNPECYEMVKDFIVTAMEVERNGIYVDQQKLDDLEEHVVSEEERLRNELMEFHAVSNCVNIHPKFQEAVKRGQEPDLSKIISVKNDTFIGYVAKAYKVYKYGNKTKTKVTFGKNILPNILHMLKKNPSKNEEGIQVFERLQQLRFWSDLKSKFLNNWKIWLSPQDSKFHCDYRIIKNMNIGYAKGKDIGGGSQSGRMAATKINPQQIYKLAMLREPFVALSEEFIIAEFDYKSLEPMVMAYVTGCQRLKDTFWKALDIYRVMCNDMYNKGVDLDHEDLDFVRSRLEDPEVVSDAERKKFKVGFLMWVYGGGYRRLADLLGVSEEEAKDFIRRAEQTYYEIFEWKKTIFEIVETGQILYTHTGRQRTLPIAPAKDSSDKERERVRMDTSKAKRIAANMCVQSLGSDILMIQAGRIRRWIHGEGLQEHVKMFNLVHDSIWFYIRKSKAKEMIPKIKQMMEDVSEFKFKIDVPLTVEYTVGNNLAQSMGLDSQAKEQEQLRRELGLIDS